MKAAKFSPKRLQIALIGVPMLLGVIYYLVFAADRYVSESIVTVKSAEVAPTVSAGLTAGGLSGLATLSDTLYLIDFVHSGTLLQELETKLKLRAHYETPKRDFVFRLWSSASQEKFLDYFRNRVEIEFDDISGLLTIRAQGFDRDTAVKLNQAILDASERFVNDFSHRVAREQMQFAEGETRQASQRVSAAKSKVVDFQAKNRIVDPLAQSAAASSLTAELQATLARLEAELKSKQAYLQEDSFPIKTLREQIAANRSQLETERLRATATGSGDRLTTLNVEYTNLLLQATFAEDAYRSAVAALDAARIDAARKLKSLVIVEAPLKPDEAIYPARIYNLITLLVGCIILYAVVRLVIATIQEHQD